MTRAIVSLLLLAGICAAEPVPIRADNAKEWASNYATAPLRTRSGSTVRVYVRKEDPNHYYVVTSRQKESEAVKVTIDGVSIGLATTGLVKIKVPKPPASEAADLLVSAP
jgi:hypothetical protein